MPECNPNRNGGIITIASNGIVVLSGTMTSSIRQLVHLDIGGIEGRWNFQRSKSTTDQMRDSRFPSQAFQFVNRDSSILKRVDLPLVDDPIPTVPLEDVRGILWAILEMKVFRAFRIPAK